MILVLVFNTCSVVSLSHWWQSFTAVTGLRVRLTASNGHRGSSDRRRGGLMAEVTDARTD